MIDLNILASKKSEHPLSPFLLAIAERLDVIADRLDTSTKIYGYEAGSKTDIQHYVLNILADKNEEARQRAKAEHEVYFTPDYPGGVQLDTDNPPVPLVELDWNNNQNTH